MHYADILARLYKSGNPPGKVASDLSVTPSAVSQVIHGKKNSYNIASHIAVVTNTPLNKLWPDKRYDRAPKEKRAAA